MKLSGLLVTFLLAQLPLQADVVSAAVAALPHYTATYLPYNAPKKSEKGQEGTNAVCLAIRSLSSAFVLLAQHGTMHS